MDRQALPTLLLLPFPPVPPTRPALNAAYRPPLAAALARGRMEDAPSRLVVALMCPILSGPIARQRRIAWSDAQSLIAGIYAILAAICAELGVAADIGAGPGSVDARVLLVDHDRERPLDNDFDHFLDSNGTIVPSLPAFASAYHPWGEILTVSGEPGSQVRETYLRYAERSQTILQHQLVSVAGGLSMRLNASTTSMEPTSSDTSPTYHVVCLGGTFDHLHPGHKLLLTAAALLLQVPEAGSGLSCEFVIGITGDELLKKKKFADLVQPWSERAANVMLFLETLLSLSPNGHQHAPTAQKEGDYQALFRNGSVKVQCVAIHDPFGPTITRADMDVLVVSAETASGGKAVNNKRSEQGWPDMHIFQVDVLDATDVTGERTSDRTDFSSKLSSTAIRERLASETQAG